MTKKTKLITSCFILIAVINLYAIPLKAQFLFTGQLRVRTEVRNGFGNLMLKNSNVAAFTSQRTRLTFGYKWDRLTFGASIQDVRVWGQDASSISAADGNRLMMHEGWADLTLFNKLDSTIKLKGPDFMSLKIGRQELIYDDSRLIGNLDWLQQARRHDMVLLKTLHKGWQIDLGYAFNQNTDAFSVSGTGYVPANVGPYVKNSLGIVVPTPAGILPLAPGGSANNNSSKSGTPVWLNPPNTNSGNQQYKSFTSLYISKKIKQTKLSALFFNDRFGKYKIDSMGSEAAGYVYGKRFVAAGPTDGYDYTGTNGRFTYGLMINQTIGNGSGFGVITVQANYYSQSGKNRDGVAMKNAYYYALSATWQKGKISLTPGYEFLSGNDASTPEDEKFDPLYGTPHRHWGFMDYFYAGTGSPNGGIKNGYAKLRYTIKTLTLGADYHFFSINENMKKADGTNIGTDLGNEIDLSLNYNMNRITNIELGYSMMAATRNMPFAKGQVSTDAAADLYDLNGNWFYASIRFTPDFLAAKSSTQKQ